MIPEFTEQVQFSAWPFWVLGINPEASSIEVAAAARDISTKLQFEIPGLEYFQTPLGRKIRDEFLVREAKSQLQDPQTRLIAEFWYAELAQAEQPAELRVDADNYLAKLKVKFWAD